jgi:hypothetical protein
MWREGLGVEYPADHSPYADPTLYYPPGKITLHTQNSTPRVSAKLSDQYLRQKHPTNPRITADGWILPDRKSVEDSVGGVHRSMRAWRKFLGVSHSYKARYDGGRYDLQEPTDVAKAIQEDQAMVANLLELAKGEAATLPTLPPLASGNGLQDSSVEADPEQTRQNAPSEVSIEEDIRKERLDKEAKRLRRATKSHRHPHKPSECPRCQAARAERTASRPSGSVDASTQMDNIVGGQGGTRISLSPEGAAVDPFTKGRDEWARYMGIAPASGLPMASPLQANQVRPQRSNLAGGDPPQTSPAEVSVNLDGPTEERRELLRYVEKKGLYVPSTQLPPGIDGALRPKSMGKKLKRARDDESSHQGSTSSGGGASEPTMGCGFCISGCLLCAPQSFGPHYNPAEHQQKRLEGKTERRRATNGARRQFRANLADRKRCKD